MAETLQLTDSVTTFDLNDGTNTIVPYGGFLAPIPPRRLAFSGGGFFRDGQDLLARRYANRVITISGLQIDGSSRDNLHSRMKDLETILRKAVEFSKDGIGSQVQLKYQGTGVTSAIFFNVIEGHFNPGPLTSMIQSQDRLQFGTVRLLCEPFGVEASETLENFLDDPGFEFDDGATKFVDWTVNNGTRAFDTTSPPEGLNWGKVTLNAAGAQFEVKQMKTMTAGNHVFTIKYKINGNQAFEAFISDAGGTTVGALTEDDTERTVTVTRNSGANISITAGIRTTGSVTDTDDIVLMDLAYLGDGTTAPTAWMSSRNVYNNHEDEGKLQQSKVNFLDLESIPGDVAALLQVKATEVEAHTDFWLGARHAAGQRAAGLWHEGEDFATWTSEPANANSSSGVDGRHTVATNLVDAVATGTASAVTSLTVSKVVSGDRTLLIVFVTAEDGTDGESNTSGVTYNGTAMTKITGKDQGSDSISAWYLINPDTGTHDIIASFTNAFAEVSLAGISFENVDQTSPIRDNTSASGTTGTITVTLTNSQDNDFVIAGLIKTVVAGTTPGSGQTERWDNNRGLYTDAGSTELATGASTVMDHGSSGGVWATIGVSIKTDRGNKATPFVVTKSVATPPNGTYRVLARLRSPDGHAFKVGMGYAYGGVTSDPNQDDHYTAVATTDTAFSIKTIGVITVPPVQTPTGGTEATLTLRLAIYHDDDTVATDIDLDFDWVFLLPVDDGMAYVNKTSAADVVWADSRSTLQAIYIMDSSDVVQSIPANQLGRPPEAHPDGTRLYFVSDDGNADIDDAFTVKVTYLPRHLQVA